MKTKVSIGLCSILTVSSCTYEPPMEEYTPYGAWKSNTNFIINIHDDEYEICSDDYCESGIYEYPFGKGSRTIILKDIFLTRNGSELFDALDNEAPPGATLLRTNYPDLDFTTNMNISEYQSEPTICDGKPCYYFGSLEEFSKGVVFYKD